MSIDQTLLQQVIDAARQARLDQARLASAAGVAPETISRAKKRGTIDFGTLQALAGVVGLSLALKPSGKAPLNLARGSDTQPDHLPSRNHSPLAHPSRGLAWSNSNISDESLVRNALKKGSFHLLLDASLAHGLPFVRQQWDVIQSDADARISDRARAEVGRKLANIERGLRHAQA